MPGKKNIAADALSRLDAMDPDIKCKKLSSIPLCDVTNKEEMSHCCDPNPSHVEQHRALHSNNPFCPEICFSQQVMATFLSETDFMDKSFKENIKECLGLDKTAANHNCPLKCIKIDWFQQKDTNVLKHLQSEKFSTSSFNHGGWKECDSSHI